MLKNRHFVCYVSPGDERFQLLRKIWLACDEAGVEIPEDVQGYFSGIQPEAGIIHNATDIKPVSEGNRKYWEVRLDDPRLAKAESIRFYFEDNSKECPEYVYSDVHFLNYLESCNCTSNGEPIPVGIARMWLNLNPESKILFRSGCCSERVDASDLSNCPRCGHRFDWVLYASRKVAGNN